MGRSPNTNKHGGSFSPGEVDAVWRKGTMLPGYDPNIFRKDTCGAVIERQRHGDTSHRYGWEIDHIKAVDNGGGDELANLQPLQWENNRAKSNGPLKCVVP